MRAAGAVLVLLCAGAQPLSAQIVRGIVTEHDSGTPLRGVFVSLLDSAGVRRHAALTDGSGVYVLRAPGDARYRVRAELIGHQTVDLTVAQAPANLDIRLAVEPIALEAISAEGEPRCVVRPQNAAETARLWDEARKALTVASWTESERTISFFTRKFDRQLGYPLKNVLWQSVQADFTAVRPYAAVSPDSLAQHGFVRTITADSTLFYGPDADVLLSDQFLDSHCFRARRGSAETSRLVGLGFEPARDVRHPDIKGTLWIDPKTRELEFIEYTYVGIDRDVNVEGVGGRTSFRRLPNGAWIVDRWVISMPVAEKRANDRARVVALFESGGEIVDVKIASETVLPKSSILGTVYDSTHARTLPGAFVYLSGTSHGTHADSAGRFEIQDVPQGTYPIAFFHPLLDSLPALPAGKIVRVEPPAAASVELAVPSQATVIAQACGQALKEGVISGYVRDTNGSALEDVTVTADYTHAGRRYRPVTKLRASGQYVLCGIPIGVRIRLWADRLRRPDFDAPGGIPQTITIGRMRFMRVDLEVK